MTRLDALTSLIVKADTVADVGCDHGYAAEFCAKNGIANRIIASDISAKCLEKAKKTLSGVQNVEFIVCDGIDYECDEAIIAGMGGILICSILKTAMSRGRLPETVVVMPHRDVESVRRLLTEYGYAIERDIIVKDRNQYYFAIRAEKKDGAQALTDLQYSFGIDYDKPNDVMREYLVKLHGTYSIASRQNKQKLIKVRQAMLAQGIKSESEIIGDI